jgi:glycosyltransferase involved in cell wall biosynthesis
VVSNQPIETTEPLPGHVRVHISHRVPLRVAWIQMCAGRVLDEVNADVAHFTNGMIALGGRAARVVTIHDMSLKLYPHCHPLRRRLINRPLSGVAARMADAIVAVSESARRDLLTFYDIPPDRVSVVHEAAGPAFVVIDDPAIRARVRMRYALPDRFILYVGAIEPRKNLPRLVDAFAAARRRGIPHELVCVGPYGWSSRDLYDHVDRLHLQDVVHFTGYLPAEDLPAVYNAAEVFAFPSLYEGFGLPVIEAMACGTPTITSRTSSLEEIAADAALTVDPCDVGALAAAMVSLAGDAGLRHTLARRGLQRAREFSWSRSARDVLALYARVVGVPVRQPAPAANVGALS